MEDNRAPCSLQDYDRKQANAKVLHRLPLDMFADLEQRDIIYVKTIRNIKKEEKLV